jgi:predicted kinase
VHDGLAEHRGQGQGRLGGAGDHTPEAGQRLGAVRGRRDSSLADNPVVAGSALCQHHGVRGDEPGSRGVNGIRAVLLTGVAGVGKSTVADAIGRVLTGAGVTTAVIDTDMLAQFGPPPGDSHFYDRLKCANLAAVWHNYRNAGARFVVVSAVIDTVALRARYAAALAGCDVQMVRLAAPAETVRQRLLGRDGRHLGALSDTQAHIADFSVVNDRPPEMVAEEVITRATR